MDGGTQPESQSPGSQRSWKLKLLLGAKGRFRQNSNIRGGRQHGSDLYSSLREESEVSPDGKMEGKSLFLWNRRRGQSKQLSQGRAMSSSF